MINGRKVPTASLSSYPRAREIATTLKEWISGGKFELTNPVAKFPDAESGVKFRLLHERPINGGGG